MEINQPTNLDYNGVFEFKWSPDFVSVMDKRFKNAQEYIDSACIRLMVPYTPMRTGLLMESAKLGTVIGSGEIVYLSPYARYLYYGEVYSPSIPILEGTELVGFFSPPGQKKHPTGREMSYDTSVHPQAGKLWFERMKADHAEEIREAAEKIAGGLDI
jgi:hypothetical protein